MCRRSKRKKKMRFCGDCARDVAACKKDAEQNGWIEVFHEQSKQDDAFQYMMLTYQEKCSGRGRGFVRNKFDHLSFREKVYSKNSVVRGTREVMKDWGEFTERYEKKGFAPAEILAKWNELLAAGVDKDQKGRKGMELRLSVEVETYKLNQTETGDERSRDLEHTSKKFKQDDVDQVDQDILSKPKLTPAQLLGSQPGSGSGSSKDGQGGNQEPGQKKYKDNPLSRRTKMHDNAVQAVRRNQDILKKLPAKMKDTISKFAAEPDYAEYMRILKVRLEICLEMGAEEEAKTREEVESIAKSSSATLKAHLESLLAESRSYIVDEGKNLRTVPECLRIAGELLTKTTHEEIDAWKSVWDDVISCLVQVTVLMEQAIKDIETAKRARDKKRQRDEQAEAKRIERENQKKLKADQKAALKAGAVRLSAQPQAPLPVPSCAHKLLETPITLLKEVNKCDEADFCAQTDSVQSAFMKNPLLLEKCEKALEKYAAIARVKAQVATFKCQFPATTQSKTTGRCQLPLSVPEHVSGLAEIFKALDPAKTSWPTTAPSGTDLSHFLAPYIYGFSSTMQYAGGEDKWAGQLRFQLEGSREVILAPFGDVRDALQKLGKPHDSLSVLIKNFANLTPQEVEKSAEKFRYMSCTTRAAVFMCQQGGFWLSVFERTPRCLG